MKKLFSLLIILFSCLAQEAGGVRFQFGNRNRFWFGNVDSLSVPQSVVDQSGYIRDLVREVGQNEALRLPEEFGRADLKNIIDYLEIDDISERHQFLRNLSKSRNKNKFYNFLKLVDYLMLNETLGFHIFDTETIKELSHLGFAKEIFKNSLEKLVRNNRREACKLYSSLEDGNQIKDLLKEIFPLWNLSARLGEVEDQKRLDLGARGLRFVGSVALSKDGKTIVSGSWSEIIVWQKNENGAGWRMVQRLDSVHRRPVMSVALSTDGKTIVSGSWDGTIIVWQENGAEWRIVQRLGKVVNQDPEVGHIGFISSISLNADGKTIVSGSGDKTIIVWQKDDATEQWQLQQRLGTLDQSSEGISLQSLRARGQELEADRIGHLGHVDYITSVALSSDGKAIVSGSDDERLIVWEKDKFGVWQIKQILGQVYNQDLEAGHVHHVTSVALSSDGKTMVSGSDDETVIVWKKDDFGQWSIKQRLVSPGGPNRLIRDRIITGVGSLTKPGEGKVKSVNISEDGKTIGAGFEGGSVWVWQQDDAGNWLFEKDLGGELISERNSITAFNLRRQVEDLRRLYESGQSGMARSSQISPISDDYHRGQVNSVALNNDGAMIVSGSDDNTVIVWEKKSIQDYCAKLVEIPEAGLVEAPKDNTSKLGSLVSSISKFVGDRGATR